MSRQKRAEWRRWGVFNLVGILGFGVQVGALFVLKRYVGLNYLTATALAVEIAVLHNFVWHEQVTWSDMVRPFQQEVFGRLLRFHVANGIISIAGNVAITWALVSSLRAPYLLANAVSVLICAVLNFIAADRFVFRRASQRNCERWSALNDNSYQAANRRASLRFSSGTDPGSLKKRTMKRVGSLQSPSRTVRVLWVMAFLLIDAASSQTAPPQRQSLHPDRLKEDVVARLFEHIRASHKLPRLSRIKSRRELEEAACTASLNESGKPYSTFGRAGYATATPEVPTPELEKIASFNYPKAGFKRYSVAVWPERGGEYGAPQYRVSIGLYASAGLEFFDKYFTDDLYYKNEWKKGIAPECKDVQ